MISDLEVNIDHADPTRVSWSCTMVVGMGITHPKPVCVLPITPEIRANIQAKADEAGMSFDDYLDMVIDEANSLEF
jgi:hypothetical protein